MRLISYHADAGSPRLGVALGERFVAASVFDERLRTFADLIADVDGALGTLSDERVVEEISASGHPLEDARLAPPVPRPGKIVCVGRNYREHVAEEDIEPPSRPIIFSKWPSSVIGDGDEIRWDPALTQQVDYEAELAAVIGRKTRRVGVESALDHVLGYTCVNDVSARDIQFGDDQWVRGKSLDTFCPMGPALVTVDEVPDPQDLDIGCRVGGIVMQESNTSQMNYGVAEIISFCSQAFTLEPGDVIATGTPGGVAVFRPEPRFLTDGDVVIVEIEGIGSLTNTCSFDPGDASQA